jgi:hypothetical protein
MDFGVLVFSASLFVLSITLFIFVYHLAHLVKYPSSDKGIRFALQIIIAITGNLFLFVAILFKIASEPQSYNYWIFSIGMFCISLSLSKPFNITSQET